jgi:hypothetical protein
MYLLSTHINARFNFGEAFKTCKICVNKLYNNMGLNRLWGPPNLL